MKTPVHFIAGGIAGSLPDIALLGFAWKREWVTGGFWLRLHRLIHSPQGLLLAILLGWISHILIDWFSPHNTQGTRP